MSAVSHLARLWAGYSERAYLDEWDGWEDPDTNHAICRVLVLAQNVDLAGVITLANAQQEFGQLELPLPAPCGEGECPTPCPHLITKGGTQ